MKIYIRKKRRKKGYNNIIDNTYENLGYHKKNNFYWNSDSSSSNAWSSRFGSSWHFREGDTLFRSHTRSGMDYSKNALVDEKDRQPYSSENNYTLWNVWNSRSGWRFQNTTYNDTRFEGEKTAKTPTKTQKASKPSSSTRGSKQDSETFSEYIKNLLRYGLPSATTLYAFDRYVVRPLTQRDVEFIPDYIQADKWNNFDIAFDYARQRFVFDRKENFIIPPTKRYNTLNEIVEDRFSLDRRRSFKKLSPDEQINFNLDRRRFESLSPSEQQEIFLNHREFHGLSPAFQESLSLARRRFSVLSPDEQINFNLDRRRFESLFPNEQSSFQLDKSRYNALDEQHLDELEIFPKGYDYEKLVNEKTVELYLRPTFKGPLSPDTQTSFDLDRRRFEGLGPERGITLTIDRMPEYQEAVHEIEIYLHRAFPGLQQGNAARVFLEAVQRHYPLEMFDPNQLTFLSVVAAYILRGANNLGQLLLNGYTGAIAFAANLGAAAYTATGNALEAGGNILVNGANYVQNNAVRGGIGLAKVVGFSYLAYLILRSFAKLALFEYAYKKKLLELYDKEWYKNNDEGRRKEAEEQALNEIYHTDINSLNLENLVFYMLQKGEMFVEKYIEKERTKKLWKEKEIDRRDELIKKYYGSLNEIESYKDASVSKILDNRNRIKELNKIPVKSFSGIIKGYSFYLDVLDKCITIIGLWDNYDYWFWDYAKNSIYMKIEDTETGYEHEVKIAERFEGFVDTHHSKVGNIFGLAFKTIITGMIGFGIAMPVVIAAAFDDFNKNLRQIGEYYGKKLNELSNYQLYKVRMNILKLLFDSRVSGEVYFKNGYDKHGEHKENILRKKVQEFDDIMYNK